MFSAAQAHIPVNVVMAGLFMLLKQSQPHLLRPLLSGANVHLPTMSGSDMFSSSGATRIVAFSAIGRALAFRTIWLRRRLTRSPFSVPSVERKKSKQQS